LNFFIYLLNEENEIHSVYSEIKCPKSGIFILIIIGWGESGKVILHVSIAVFQALSKFLSGNNGSASLEKIVPYAYAHKLVHYQSSNYDPDVSSYVTMQARCWVTFNNAPDYQTKR